MKDRGDERQMGGGTEGWKKSGSGLQGGNTGQGGDAWRVGGRRRQRVTPSTGLCTKNRTNER